MPARRSLQGIIGDNATTSLLKGQASNITTQLGALPAFTSAVTPAGSGGTTPQAWLTILFFDERFNFITAADGGLAQQQVASSVTGAGATLGPLTIKAPKNGYVFIYVSNRSDQDVYFDNLNVSIAASNIIEENHYYAYGLKIATISSKKLGDTYEGTLDNKFQMQGSFAEMDDDIGWNDFAFRNYDPQIGRWVQQDPFQQFASPYVGMGDDPVNGIDPSGGIFGLSAGEAMLGGAVVGAIIGGAVDLATGGDGKGALIGAVAGAFGGLGSIPFGVSAALQTTNVAVTVINTSVNSRQAGNTSAGLNATSQSQQPQTMGHGPAGPFGDGDNDDWLPLTKNILRDFVKKNSGRNYATDGAWEDYIGDVFENTFHQFAIFNQGLFSGFGYKPNSTPDHLDGDPPPPGIIIDAKSSIAKISYSIKGARTQEFIDAAWWEIKATDRNITWSTREYQIGLEVMNLVENHPDAVNNMAAEYNVVTTAGGNIGPSLFKRALNEGVLPVHWKPLYKISESGQMLVKFGFENVSGIGMPSGRVLMRRTGIYVYGMPTLLKF